MLKLEQNKINIQTSQENQLSRTSLVKNQNFTSALKNSPLTSRLMNTNIVRIHSDTICACVPGYRKLIFNINSISRVDDLNRGNENEVPLFYAEEKLDCGFCCFSSCATPKITFELFDPNTKGLFSKSEIIGLDTRVAECCRDSYFRLQSIFNSKMGDMSAVNRYDTRTFYRTYDYLGQSFYKIGWPYIEKEPSCCEDCSLSCIFSSLPCCCCCVCLASLCDCKKVGEGGKKECKCDCCSCCCCCCYPEVAKGDVIVDIRKYVDIFNMSDQSVGKFAFYYEKQFCNETKFYEIYFPPDSNEMIRLALIAQIIFLVKLGNPIFWTLPGSRNNVEKFMN